MAAEPHVTADPVNAGKVDRDSLDRSALSGIAWSGAAKWSTQIIAWASTILVARLLTTSDYGLLSMASVFLGIVMMLSEFGIGTSVITLRDMPPSQVQQLNTFAVILGLAGTLLTALAAYPLGVFFRAPDLPPVVVVVGLTFLISSIATVPASMLRRELRFRALAMIDIARGLLVPLVTLGGALAGLRYWALALGSVAGAVITTSLTLWFRREAFDRPHLRSLTGILRFSRDLLVARLAWISYQNGDFAVAGRRLGQSALGAYTLGWTLANTPIEKVTALLSDVTPSLFSAVQHDRSALRRYFLLLSEALCFAVVPASVGLALVSRDLVPVLLGPKWVGTAGPLTLLALYAGGRSVSSVFSHIFTVTKETRFAMWTSVVLAVLLLVGFVIGSNWGPTGIAAAWLVIHPSVSVVVFGRIRKVLDLSTVEYLQSLRLGLDGSIVMVGAVLAFQWLVAPSWSMTPRLVGSIIVGGGTFVVTTWLMHRARVRSILASVKRIRQGKPVDP